MSHHTKPTDVGKNRTGIATSGGSIDELVKSDSGSVHPDTPEITGIRLAYAQEAHPVGTMPPPVGLKGAAKAMMSKVKGQLPAVLLDKLGERLAFERGGVRLYEALLVKAEASHSHDPSLTLDALREIRDDELRHTGVLALAIARLGGDPSAVTPCADVAGVNALGFVHTLTDPRTTLTQCLGTMLQVEVADEVGWELLIELAGQLDQDDLVVELRQCAGEEERHVLQVREWVSRALLGQADRDVADAEART